MGFAKTPLGEWLPKTMAAMAAMMASAAAGLGRVTGLVDRPGAPLRNLIGGFTSLYCDGYSYDWNEEDDRPGVSPIHQQLYVDLTRADCTSTTLGLLATWLGGGITAGDMHCLNGSPSDIYSSSSSACSTVVAAFNAKLGGASFSCYGVSILVDGACREKVAVLNTGLNSTAMRCKLNYPDAPLPIISVTASWAVVDVIGVPTDVAYSYGVSSSYTKTRNESWGTSTTTSASAGFSFEDGFGAKASVTGTTSYTIAESTSSTFASTNTTTVTYHYQPGVVWQLQFQVVDQCGNSTVYTKLIAQTPNEDAPPCCLPGYFKDPTQAHGACVPGQDGQVFDICGSSPPPPGPPPPSPPSPPACAGREQAFCSPADPSTWCCNLEVFDCVCYQDGTYVEISFYCNTTKNRGINCVNCPTSPQCKTGGAATAAAALLPPLPIVF